jgi:hypothetical protein
MYEFPKEPAKIKSRISSYKRAMKKEKNTHGMISDGYGKRYLLGPLYLLLNDIKGALEHYKWFEKEFPDDSNEPFNYLCWTLSLYKGDLLKEAKNKLAQTMFSNLYLIPHLLNIKEKPVKIKPFSNYEEKEYVFILPVELKNLWDSSAMNWLHELYESDEIQLIKEQYITLLNKLESENSSDKRWKLIEKITQYKNQFK